jgi:hypothetical protein
VALKARMPLRTVCTAQHKPRAIARGLCPAALSSTIWARRTVKALGARRLERIAVRLGQVWYGSGGGGGCLDRTRRICDGAS